MRYGHLLTTIFALMDLEGFEPSTSSVRLKRAPNCATGPYSIQISSSKILTVWGGNVKHLNGFSDSDCFALCGGVRNPCQKRQGQAASRAKIVGVILRSTLTHPL